MYERKLFTVMSRLTAGAAALMIAASLAGCGNSQTTDSAAAGNEETTTTAAAAPETTEAPEAAETTAAETTKAADSSSEAPKETTAVVSGVLPDEFDDQLDSMIASAEAMIPDVPTIDFGSKTDTDSGAKSETAATTTTTTAKTTAAPTPAPETTTTTTTAAAKTETPSAAKADLKNVHQFCFDGVTYDNANFTSAGLTVSAGWTLNNSVTEGQYVNSAYPGSFVIEDRNKGGTFLIAEAKSKGESSIPSLQLYKGLTWGASADDIKAAYGEPAKEGHSEQFDTQLTNLFYNSSESGLIIYEVSSDWGLIAVNCCGK